MIRCEVVTPWRRVNGVNEMAVALDYPASWSDATGQPDENIIPEPNAFVAYGEVSEAQMAALEADDRYVVLWSEPIEVWVMSKKPETPAQMQARRADDKPTQSEFGQMVTRLAQKSVTGRALVDAISSAKTRRENAEEVKAWCRKLPKA